MTRRDVPGTTYLVHLDPPYKHARHYLGFAEGGEDQLADRLAEHGGAHGSRLLAAAKAAGHAWHLTRTWPGTTRAFERQLKNTRHVPHYCPDCQPQRSAARRAARTTTATPTTTNRKDITAMTASAPEPERGRPPSVSTTAMRDAERSFGAAVSAGLPWTEAGNHGRDVAAWLLTEAATEPGRQYAAAYAETVEAMISEAAGRHPAGPPAAALPDGTPHHDPALAAKGWEARNGLYQRTAAPLAGQPAATTETTPEHTSKGVEAAA